MRNLKKFLALVLAVMMVMSLMITADAAVNIKTSSDVTVDYEMAVDVLHKIGVLEGESGGVYNPQELIPRKELAMLLFRITTGYTSYKVANTMYAEDVKYYYDDVPANSWYAGVVAYVSINNLMQGFGSRTFDPNGYVDGLQLVTVLTRLLGYDQNKELSGASYKPMARQWARTTGVADDLTTSDLANVIGEKNVTRQVVAQMVYNTLMLDYVEYTAMGYIPARYVTSDNRTPGRMYYKLGRYARNEPSDWPAGITVADFERDEFGRPEATHILTVKNEVIYKERPTPIGIYDGNFTGNVVKSLGRNLTKSEVAIYYNGAPVADGDKLWFADAEATPGSAAGMWADDIRGIPGFEIEVYKHVDDPNTTADDNIKYDIIFCEAFLAVVGATDKTTGEIDLKIYGVGANESPTMKIKTTDAVYDDLASLKENDYVAVYPTPNWNNSAEHTANRVKILKVAKLDKVQGSVTEVYNSKAHGKWESTVELKSNNQYKKYGFTQEALLLKGAASSTGFTRTNVIDAVDLGVTTLYLHHGNILLIDQRPAAQDPTYVEAGYAYFYDVKHFTKSTDSTTQSWDTWDSEGGQGASGAPASTTHHYAGRLLLPNGNTLGGYDEGVEIKLANETPYTPTGGTASVYAAYEAELGKLVMYKKNAGGWYDITPVGGVNLGGMNNTANDPKFTYVNISITQNGGNFSALSPVGEGSLKITKNKSEGIMPSTTALTALNGGTGNASNVAFDLETAIYVVKTGLNALGQPDFRYECNVYTIEDLPADINVNQGLVTVVGDFANPASPSPVKLDGELDSGKLKVARAVLIVDSGLRDTSLDPYFIVYKDKAPLVGLYKDKPGETQPFWFYEFDAVVGGVYQKILVDRALVGSGGTMFDTDSLTVGTDNYWLGTKVSLAPYVNEKGETKWVIDTTSLTGATALDSDTVIDVTSVTKYEYGRIGVNGKTGTLAPADFQLPAGWTDASGESYIVRTGGKAFTYDLKAGTITEISIGDFTATSVASGGTYFNSTGIAIRSSSHYDLNALFINKTPAP